MEKYDFNAVNGEKSSYDFKAEEKVNYTGLPYIVSRRPSGGYNFEDSFNPRYSVRVLEPRYRRAA